MSEIPFSPPFWAPRGSTNSWSKNLRPKLHTGEKRTIVKAERWILYLYFANCGAVRVRLRCAYYVLVFSSRVSSRVYRGAFNSRVDIKCKYYASLDSWEKALILIASELSRTKTCIFCRLRGVKPTINTKIILYRSILYRSSANIHTGDSYRRWVIPPSTL